MKMFRREGERGRGEGEAAPSLLPSLVFIFRVMIKVTGLHIELELSCRNGRRPTYCCKSNRSFGLRRHKPYLSGYGNVHDLVLSVYTQAVGLGVHFEDKWR